MKIPALLLALLGAPALAGDDARSYSFTLAGKAFDERCLALAAGESVRYRFSSSAPIDFNIHYHRGDEMFFPVRRPAVREVDSTFTAKRAGGHCLMWEHRGPGAASVEGSVERLPRR